MANEIYNSSYWGNGVCDNAIDWGVVYKDFAGCTPTPDPFTNTYSLAFDGVDDTVNFQNDWFAPSTPSQTTGNTVGSISFWVKLPTNINSGGLVGMVSINVGSNAKPLIWLTFNKSTQANRYIRAYVSGANSTETGVLQSQQFFVYDNSNPTYPNSGISFDADTWYHIAVVYDKNATNRYKAYINGNEFLIPNTTGSGSNGERTIGEMPYSLPYNPTAFGISPNIDLGFSRISSSGGTYYFEGNLDEVAFWNSALTSGNISTIYNSGAPNDLTSLNPIAWYRMGDNGSYKSPQWLIPENSNKDKVSNYSFSFDGVDDYVDTGAIDLGETNTISFWFKNNSANTGNGVIGDADNHVVYFQTVNLFYYPVGSTTGRKTFGGTNIANAMADTTNWHNLILIRKAPSNGISGYNDLACYLDGNLEGTHINIYTANINLIPLYIGKSGLISSNTYDGLIDEVSYYDNDQTANVSSIYNSGVPTTITGAVAHWKMGEEATFSTNWTVPDQVGSNDGISANMTIEDRVGEASMSSNNAVSFNQVEADRETDVPT
jgi:hypothetical protein